MTEQRQKQEGKMEDTAATGQEDVTGSEYEDVNLWIGGSSSLARTFFVNYDRVAPLGTSDNDSTADADSCSDCYQASSYKNNSQPPKKWVVTGVEEHPPSWMIPFMMNNHNNQTDQNKKHLCTNTGGDGNDNYSAPSVIIDYAWLDLTLLTAEMATEFFTFLRQRKKKRILNIVVGIRPKLFDKYIYTSYPRKMVEGLEFVLREAMMISTKSEKMEDSHDWKTTENHYHNDRRHHSLPFVLHLSSVAAVDHLTTQHFVIEEEGDENENHTATGSLPPLSTYRAPYDRFKRESEDMIARICRQAAKKESTAQSLSARTNKSYCHLRISALFSDDERCIQCNALGLQAYLGAEMPLAIDCNSSLNVANAMYFLLTVAGAQHQQLKRLDHVYYYTRPLSLSIPVPYGYYLREYRRAYGISTSDGSRSDKNETISTETNNAITPKSWMIYLISPISIPVWLVVGLTHFIHLLAIWNRRVVSFGGTFQKKVFYRKKKVKSDHDNDDGDVVDTSSHWREEDDHLLWKGLPYLDSIDYLLQVATREHSFDCARFKNLVDANAALFSSTLSSAFQEENMYECFTRRKVYLYQEQKLQAERRVEYLKEQRKLEYERLRRQMENR